jgi:hypothetical protein
MIWFLYSGMIMSKSIVHRDREGMISDWADGASPGYNEVAERSST